MNPEEAMAMAEAIAEIRKRRVLEAVKQRMQSAQEKLASYRSSYDGQPSALELLMGRREQQGASNPTVAMSGQSSHASKVPYGYGG